MEITKEMTLADIMKKLPGAAEIMIKHGLHCVGCSVNVFETLEQGTVGHGMDESDMETILKDLNELAKKPRLLAEIKEKRDISLTKNTIEKLRELMKKQKKEDNGLRIGVVPGGCAGFQYNMEFEKKPSKDDKVIEIEGIKIFMDERSREYMNGAVIDFVDSLQGSGFKIENPNAKSSCGCGKSFG